MSACRSPAIISRDYRRSEQPVSVFSRFLRQLPPRSAKPAGLGEHALELDRWSQSSNSLTTSSRLLDESHSVATCVEMAVTTVVQTSALGRYRINGSSNSSSSGAGGYHDELDQVQVSSELSTKLALGGIACGSTFRRGRRPNTALWVTASHRLYEEEVPYPTCGPLDWYDEELGACHFTVPAVESRTHFMWPVHAALFTSGAQAFAGAKFTSGRQGE